MINSQRLRAFLWLKGIIRITSPTSQWFRLLQPYHSPTFSVKFSTIASSGNHSFTVSYLINNLGFSQEAALHVSKTVRFETGQKPDAAVSFFRSHGFSQSQINDLVKRLPGFLICNPHRSILPKFEFLLSKGASTSDLNFMVLRTPRFLRRSLENHIIPSYEMLRGFLHSDKATISCIKGYPDMLYDNRVIGSINTLLKHGVSRTNIALLLTRRPRVLHSTDFLTKVVEEVKGFGFNPLTTTFTIALIAKAAVSNSRWAAKVDVYKRWGWSEAAWSEAFRKQPHIMLASNDKIDAVMSFWSNHLGWNPLALVKGPNLFGHSLKKRIIPRAAVLDYLQSKGLVKNNASIIAPFEISEKRFLERFVKRYEEHSHHLLKLCEKNLKNDGMSCA